MSLHELKRNLVYKKLKNTTCLKNTKSTIEYAVLYADGKHKIRQIIHRNWV